MLALVLIGALATAALASQSAEAPGPATYAGSAACASCHAAEHRRWQASPHALAMRAAIAVGELRDLTTPIEAGYGSGATATLRGGDAASSARPSVSIAETDVAPGPYEVPLVLGGKHITQPLAALGGGRLQALPIGYDAATQTWFDIFAASPRRAEDWGHWSNRGMTANSECIACHVTGFRKGYRVGDDTYETSYAEPTVGCEACHGPGARHVEVRTVAARSGNHEPVADHYSTASGEPLLAVCASCHALRREISQEFTPGMHLLDAFEPVLLQEGDYRGDGAVAEEAYEWGSFVQSRMYAKGVVCGDCHDAHDSALRAEGDALCRTCHETKLKTPRHSHHDDAVAKTTCASCHMPETVFMERDRRRDHSFSLPDPKRSEIAGGRSVCVSCHTEKDEAWASRYVEEWFPATAERRAERRALAEAFLTAAGGDAASLDRVLDCARACESPIRRATAAKLLVSFTAELSAREALIVLAADADDLVRNAAVWALAESQTAAAPAVASALIAAAGDPRRAVRINAAWGLRAAPLGSMDAAARDAVERASRELVASLDLRADSAEARFTKGSFFEARGDAESAIAEYRAALAIAPASVPPRYRLAMLLVASRKLDDARRELTALREHDSRFAPAHFALGLVYGELGEWREAVRSLTECLKVDPYYPEALHDLAHAYLELEQGRLANEVLEAALEHPRARPEALATLVSVNLALGDRETAKRWARTGAAELPGFDRKPSVAALLAE